MSNQELIRVADFTVAAELPNGKQMAINGCIFQGETEAQVNERADLYFRVVNRQRAIAEIPILELQHEKLKKAIDDSRNTLLSFDEKAKNGTLSSVESNHYKSLMKSLADQVGDLEKGVKVIQEAKDKIK